ncbi:MAG: DNA polymerase III subunit gamma/tau [Planctomycetota bacterium]
MAGRSDSEAAVASDAAENEPYQVVARRFRPQTFTELVGQDDVLQSLRVALTQQRVPHAFVFSGSRGVGKTTSARILARCLNCEKGPTPDPCGVCSSCRSILDGSNPDVIEVDAASNNGVDDVRRLRESVSFATMQSRYRVVILDEAHMMSKAAFNALLKTLEEPPPKVVFVLATTERHKLPDTIQSRCQVLLFKRVGEEDLVKRLRMIAEKEGASIADDVLAEIAGSVRGGVRDAETALERVLPLAREHGDGFDLAAYRTLTARVGTDAVVEVVAELLQGNAKAGLHFAAEMQQHGTDERDVLGEIVEALRWLLLLKVDGKESVLVSASGAMRELLQKLADEADTTRLDAMIGAGLLGRDRLRRLEDRSAVFELALVRMAQAGAMPTLADLLAEVRAGGGGGTQRSAAGAASPPAAGNHRGAAGGSRAGGPGSGGAGFGGAPARTSVRPGGRAASPPPPAAAAAAATPAVPVASSEELKARLLNRLNDRKLLQATLEQCRIEGPSDTGQVVITCESPRKMYRDRLKSPAIEQEVRAAVLECAGRPVQVEFRVSDKPTQAMVAGAGAGGCSPATGGPGAAASPVDVPPGERTKRVIKRFGGRVVQIDPPDRVRPVAGEGDGKAGVEVEGTPDPDAPISAADGGIPDDVQPGFDGMAGGADGEMLDPGLPPGA